MGGTCFLEYFLDLSCVGQVYVEIRLQVPSGLLKIPDKEGKKYWIYIFI